MSGGFFSSGSGRTRAQQLASRRNLVKARAAQVRRRRQADLAPLYGKLLVVLVLGLLVFVLVAASGGAALISFGLIAAAIVIRRRKRAAEERVDAAHSLRIRLERAESLRGLLDQTPREFEEAVALILQHMGFEGAAVVGGANDHGADITATSPEGERVIVQCKQYTPGNKVTSPDMQLFHGAKHHHSADRAIYVTTSTFTDPAIAYAEVNGIELIDGDRLTGWARLAAELAEEVEEMVVEEAATVTGGPDSERSPWATAWTVAQRPSVLVAAAVVVLLLGLAAHGSGGRAQPVASEKTISPSSSVATSPSSSGVTTTPPVDVSTSTTEDLAELDATIGDQIARVDDSASSLSDAEAGIDDSVAELPTTLADVRDHLQTTKADAESVRRLAAGSPEPGEVCVAASQVSTDVSQLASDGAALAGIGTRLDGAIVALRSAQERVRRELTQLGESASTVAGHDAAGATIGSANAALAAADKRVVDAQMSVKANQAEAARALAAGRASEDAARSLCG